jgi:hypothetical protein
MYVYRLYRFSNSVFCAGAEIDEGVTAALVGDRYGYLLDVGSLTG